jgi:flavin reductase (DIM6/NTAB) family NADH-FMN oxidoreductase RutF
MDRPVATPSPEARPGATDPADRETRRALWSLTSGLYLVGSAAGGEQNLMTASWAMQVAVTPTRQVALGLETSSKTLELVSRSGVFALSILGPRHRALLRRFVKPVPPTEVQMGPEGRGTLRDVPVRLCGLGVPVLEDAVAWLACRVTQRLALGSHELVVGQVQEAGAAPGEGRGGEPGTVLVLGETPMRYGG